MRRHSGSPAEPAVRRASRYSGARIRGRILALVMAVCSLASCQSPSLDDSTASENAGPLVTSIPTPRAVLLIGNSFTYYNGGIDLHLAMLAASASPPVPLEVESQTTPSQTLRGHFEDRETARVLVRRNWDVVVLQGASYEPVDSGARGEFFEFARILDSEIDKIGAQTAFFMTWAWQFRPGMASRLRDAYVKQGNESHALVVPVGLAWERVQEERPDIQLFSDLKHSSLEGTYLAACVFYSALLGRSPEGLSYQAGIDDSVARDLQRIAWDTTEAFYGRGVPGN